MLSASEAMLAPFMARQQMAQLPVIELR